jgi:hypothetical protein
MSKGAPSLFHNVSTYMGEVIEYWIKFSFKSNLKIIGEFGCTLGILGKPSMGRI